MYTQTFSRWWLLTLKGISLILLGILAVIFPLQAISSVVFVIGILLVIGGAFLIYKSVSHRGHYKYWVYWMIEGVIDIIFGLLILFSVQDAIAALFTLLGIWAISSGIVQLLCSFMIPWRKFYWILNGLLSVIMGTLLVLNPFAGAVVASYFIAIYGISLGALAIYISTEFKQIHDKHEEVHLLIN